MKVVSAGLTDVGRKRNHNEDSFLINEELQLFVVADGMGGHAGGGGASSLAGQSINDDWKTAQSGKENPFGKETSLQDSPLPEVIRAAVERACQTIFN